MRSILITTLAGWIARALAIVTNIIGLPVALHSLGQTRFGLFLMVLSIGSWIGLGNAGFGRVVAIITARYYGKTPGFVAAVTSHLVRRAVRYYALLFVGCCAIFLAVARFHSMPSGADAYAGEFAISTIAVFFSMSLWFFLAVFEGIDAGRHKLFRLYWYQIGAYLLSLVMMFTMLPRWPSLLLASLLLSSGFVLGNLLHALDVYKRHRSMFTAVRPVPRALSRAVLFHSIDFTVIAIALSVIYQFVTGLVGMVTGPDQIVNLGVFMRIMVSAGGAILTVTGPMSNLIATRIAHQDTDGARRIVALTGIGLLGTMGCAAIAFDIAGERLLSVWLHTPVVYDADFRQLAAAMIFLTALHSYASAAAIGFGHLRQVARIHAVMALAVLPSAFAMFAWRGQGGVLMTLDMALALGALASLGTVLPATLGWQSRSSARAGWLRRNLAG